MQKKKAKSKPVKKRPALKLAVPPPDNPAMRGADQVLREESGTLGGPASVLRADALEETHNTSMGEQEDKAEIPEKTKGNE